MQLVMDVASKVSEYVPATHPVQTVLAGSDAYFPAVQLEQGVSARRSTSAKPRSQGRQALADDAASTEEWRPAGQSTQVGTDATVDSNRPAEHLAHGVDGSRSSSRLPPPQSRQVDTPTGEY